MARCELRGSKAESAARRLLPFLQLKREQAILLLEIGRLRPRRRLRVRERGAACVLMEGVRQALRSSHDGTRPTGKLVSSRLSLEGYQELTPEQLGWTREQLLSYLAGIIDSDGNLRIERKRVRGMIGPHYRINIRCGQVLPSRAVELLAKTFGGHVGLRRSRRPNCRDLATWSLYDRAAESAIRALLPYLVVKKTEALHLLELRWMKAQGKNGLTEWVHANRWRASVRMRKRCYTFEQIAEFERIFLRVQHMHSPDRRSFTTTSNDYASRASRTPTVHGRRRSSSVLAWSLYSFLADVHSRSLELLEQLFSHFSVAGEALDWRERVSASSDAR